MDAEESALNDDFELDPAQVIWQNKCEFAFSHCASYVMFRLFGKDVVKVTVPSRCVSCSACLYLCFGRDTGWDVLSIRGSSNGGRG